MRFCRWRKRIEYDIRGRFPGEYSPGNIPRGRFGNITRSIYSGEDSLGIFPGGYSPGEYSLGISLGEYSPGMFPGEYSLGNIPGARGIFPGDQLQINYETIYNNLGFLLIEKDRWKDPYADCDYVSYLYKKISL